MAPRKKAARANATKDAADDHRGDPRWCFVGEGSALLPLAQEPTRLDEGCVDAAIASKVAVEFGAGASTYATVVSGLGAAKP